MVIVVTKFISLHQTVSTEVTLIRNSVEIDKKGHTKYKIWDKVKIV